MIHSESDSIVLCFFLHMKYEVQELLAELVAVDYFDYSYCYLCLTGRSQLLSFSPTLGDGTIGGTGGFGIEVVIFFQNLLIKNTITNAMKINELHLISSKAFFKKAAFSLFTFL